MVKYFSVRALEAEKTTKTKWILNCGTPCIRLKINLLIELQKKVGFKFSEKVLVALKCVYYLPVSPDDPSVDSYLEQVWQTACHTNRQH